MADLIATRQPRRSRAHYHTRRRHIAIGCLVASSSWPRGITLGHRCESNHQSLPLFTIIHAAEPPVRTLSGQSLDLLNLRPWVRRCAHANAVPSRPAVALIAAVPPLPRRRLALVYTCLAMPSRSPFPERHAAAAATQPPTPAATLAVPPPPPRLHVLAVLSQPSGNTIRRGPEHYPERLTAAAAAAQPLPGP